MSKPFQNSTGQILDRRTDATKAASLELIKIAIDKDTAKEKEFVEEVTSQLIVLFILAPNQPVRDGLKFRCTHKSHVFKAAAYRNKTKKMVKQIY